MFERWDAEQTEWVKGQTGLLEPQARDFHALKVGSYETTEHHGNVITNAGWQAILALATTGAGTVYSTTKGRIGVGDSATAGTATDTDLAGGSAATNEYFKLCQAAPTVGTGTNRTWIFTATFGTGQGNFAWAGFGIDSGTADGATVTAALLNHAASAQGTKASGQTWTVTATLSFT